MKCPFCETEGDFVRVKSRFRKGTANRVMYWVKCDICGAEQRHDNLAGYKNKFKAESAWNSKQGF